MNAWSFLRPELGEYIEVLAPQKRTGEDWYLGTADAIYQNLYSIEPVNPSAVLVLSGDHIYKMNYQKMIASHHRTDADITVAAIPMLLSEARRFGILETDADSRVAGFQEKPEEPRAMPQQPGFALVSMGIYVFKPEVLMKACCEDHERAGSHDFGKDIIPRLIDSHRMFAYRFVDENKKSSLYWRDVGTLRSYWEANMDLVSVDPEFNLYDHDWPIRTLGLTAPPAKFVFGDEGIRYGVAVDSIVSPGCIISGGKVERTVLSPDVRINSYSHVQESIIMHGASVGRHSRIRRAIIEKRTHVPEYSVIGYDPEKDAARFHVSKDGLVIVRPTDFKGAAATASAAERARKESAARTVAAETAVERA